MNPAGRFVTRHALGWGAAALAMLVLPHVASEISWKLSGLLDGSGGMHIYSLGWGGSEATVDDYHAVIDPLSPAVLLTLCAVSLLCVAGDLARHKFPWLRWALPILPAVPLGIWFALLAGGEGFPADLPPYVPLVIGVTFTLITAILVGAYWAVVLLTARATSARAEAQ